MTRLVVDPARPDRAAIERAARSLRRGGVVAIPTDTLYGFAVDPFNPVAVMRVFEIKGRGVERALPLIAADAAQVREWIGELPALAARLAEQFWPGPLTLLMRGPDTLAAGVMSDGGAVGVRVPAHAVPRALCAAAGRPLTATSANISGAPPTDDPSRVAEQFRDSGLDLLLDAGPTPGGRPSTIVDVTGPEPQLIRAGAISWDEVRACVQHG
jgi:L-threonylcarbamoyladenylate synthase